MTVILLLHCPPALSLSLASLSKDSHLYKYTSFYGSSTVHPLTPKGQSAYEQKNPQVPHKQDYWSRCLQMLQIAEKQVRLDVVHP